VPRFPAVDERWFLSFCKIPFLPANALCCVCLHGLPQTFQTFFLGYLEKLSAAWNLPSTRFRQLLSYRKDPLPFSASLGLLSSSSVPLHLNCFDSRGGRRARPSNLLFTLRLLDRPVLAPPGFPSPSSPSVFFNPHKANPFHIFFFPPPPSSISSPSDCVPSPPQSPPLTYVSGQTLCHLSNAKQVPSRSPTTPPPSPHPPQPLRPSLISFFFFLPCPTNFSKTMSRVSFSVVLGHVYLVFM